MPDKGQTNATGEVHECQSCGTLSFLAEPENIRRVRALLILAAEWWFRDHPNDDVGTGDSFVVMAAEAVRGTILDREITE